MSSTTSTSITSIGDGNFKIRPPEGLKLDRLEDNSFVFRGDSSPTGRNSSSDSETRSASPKTHRLGSCDRNRRSAKRVSFLGTEHLHSGAFADRDYTTSHGSHSSPDGSEYKDGSARILDCRETVSNLHNAPYREFDVHSGFNEPDAEERLSLQRQNKALKEALIQARSELATASSMVKGLAPALPHYTAHLDRLSSSHEVSDSQLPSSQSCLDEWPRDSDARSTISDARVHRGYATYSRQGPKRASRGDTGFCMDC
jgi:hypothetical protein